MQNALAEKAVLASLTISGWSARKLDREVTDKVNEEYATSPDAGRYNKLLVNKKGIMKIEAVRTAARIYHFKVTQPWLDNGARVLPSMLYLKYTEQMQKYQGLYEKAFREFEKDFPSYIEDAKKRLNGMFNADDYPTPSQLRKMFSFTVRMFPIPDADDFRVSVSKATLKAMREDVESTLQAAMEASTRDIKERLVKTVGHMAERLSGYKKIENGKGKKKGKRTINVENKFSYTLVENVRELAELLPAFNLNNDPKLDAIIKRIQKELCAEDAPALRDNDELRKDVAKSAADILKEVEAFMA